jgi:hypothetical protein
MDELPAFLTGSRIYGIPTDKSDLDLVVYMPHGNWEQTAYIFKRCSDNDQGSRFGNMNLIKAATRGEYLKWKLATEACVAYKARLRVAGLKKSQSYRIFDSFGIHEYDSDETSWNMVAAIRRLCLHCGVYAQKSHRGLVCLECDHVWKKEDYDVSLAEATRRFKDLRRAYKEWQARVRSDPEEETGGIPAHHIYAVVAGSRGEREVVW